MSENSFFFYGEHKLPSAKDALTGTEIKTLIKEAVPSFDVSHTLILEGHGAEADREIKDGDVVSLGIGHGEGPKHFFSKPPTNFGFI